MNILIVGAGGREHALAWHCARSPRVSKVIVAPGNAGTETAPGITNAAVDAADIDGLLALAQDAAIDLTIIGPEQPLVDGICDRFASAGLACFGPSAKAARLEGSKAFSKAFLQRHGIPTAAYQSFCDFDRAQQYIRAQGAPLVVKADGLAAGKGVVVAHSVDEAIDAARDMLDGARFGSASQRIVVEEFLAGEEASFIAITDGKTVLPLATSQDHKARDAGDQGPNTGGMGAYSPAPVVTDAIARHVMQDIMQATVDGLANDGIPYVGFLYAGLMIDAAGNARVLEFNCRFGDPETQPVLMRLQSDLTVLCEAALTGTLHEVDVEWDKRAALGIVLAAGGYPGSYDTGAIIDGLDADLGDDVTVFHAGTKTVNGRVVSNSGRVLCVTALGDNVRDAADKAYQAADKIHWEGRFFRPDIGYRAIRRELQPDDD